TTGEVFFVVFLVFYSSFKCFFFFKSSLDPRPLLCGSWFWHALYQFLVCSLLSSSPLGHIHLINQATEFVQLVPRHSPQMAVQGSQCFLHVHLFVLQSFLQLQPTASSISGSAAGCSVIPGIHLPSKTCHPQSFGSIRSLPPFHSIIWYPVIHLFRPHTVILELFHLLQ